MDENNVPDMRPTFGYRVNSYQAAQFRIWATVFDFELSQQEMFEIASLKADGIGSDPDTCDF